MSGRGTDGAGDEEIADGSARTALAGGTSDVAGQRRLSKCLEWGHNGSVIPIPSIQELIMTPRLPHYFTLAILAGMLASPLRAQTTELVTHGIDGQTNAEAIYAEITADGRYVTFQSPATNLVVADTNGSPDCFMYDRESGQTVRVSVSSSGAEAQAGGLEPVISFDNRYVTFYSLSDDLVASDGNGKFDIFLHHLPTGTTSKISEATNGADANGGSRYPVLSFNGRYIAFESKASNLVSGDSNSLRDVFVHDRVTGVTSRVSESGTGQQGNGESVDAFISPDGRYVAFESDATNLVPVDTNARRDVFVKDLQTGAVILASVDSAGLQGNRDSQNASLSEFGLRIAFSSNASNLVPMDANGYEDLFVHDLATGITERINVSTAGEQGHIGAYEVILSPDGGFAVFFSGASNHVPNDTNSDLDIFVRDIGAGTTERISIGSLGQEGTGECLYPAISDGGRYIAFDSTSDNLVVGDSNGVGDIFIVDRYSPFSPYCSGDGSLTTPCPCGNNGDEGHGCENSAGLGGATLVASGSTEADSVLFYATGLPSSTVTVLLQAQNDSSNPGISFGDGILCATGAIKRLYVKVGNAGTISAPGAGDLSIQERSAALGDPLVPGTTRYYQVYYRDANGTFCPPNTFNTSNGIQIDW
ncbi:MAG: Tol biopolymer transport system component [Candidatus Paceibacteria bacterium]|jgi:Tol biopolymer transport system component